MSQSRRETPVQETKKPKATVFQSVVTGSVAGAVEVLVDHPLWSIAYSCRNEQRFRSASEQ